MKSVATLGSGPTRVADSASVISGRQMRHAGLGLAALGIVFGDIGTSPLYALRETVQAAGGATHDAVLGSVSLILWALILSTTLAYVNAILRVDNHGEGGILSLAALLSLHKRLAGGTSRRKLTRNALLGVALVGAAMLFGDAIITPAISVLSAVEGMNLAMPGFHGTVLPIAAGVLLGFFALQAAGTSRIGMLFGPVMLVWFASIGILGLLGALEAPQIFAAADPRYALALLQAAPGGALVVLAAVFLAVTGGEALYADLGQFGRRPIAHAWYTVALPGLALNYVGQGAELLANPAAIADPFYSLAPEALRFPLVILATTATIIASQAVVTGIFSVVRQAGQLGFLPPLTIRHTSRDNEHHIYIGLVNVVVGALSILVVLRFGSSDSLADAYGLAVSIAMIATSILFVTTLAMVHRWRWIMLAPVAALILGLDVTFVTANGSKIMSGGWLPGLLALAALLVMVAWIRGRTGLHPAEEDEPIGHFARRAGKCTTVLPRTAVFLSEPGRHTPAPLIRMKRLYETTFRQVVLVTVWVRSSPLVAASERVHVVTLGERISRIDVSSGYMQETDLPTLLGPAFKALGVQSDEVSYILGHDHLRRPQFRWRPRDVLTRPLDMLFLFLDRNAQRTADRFNLPARRTLILGSVQDL